MSKEHLRTDKECANCGYTVDVAYCSKCGQKNTETRQPFHHLIAHFVEDLTHYDGAFWKTIKYLLFRPGKLTKTYLEGHRQAFVPPVKLYIFISFVTFFGLSILTSSQEKEFEMTRQEIANTKFSINGYSSVKQLDSVQQSKPPKEKLSPFGYKILRRTIELREEGFSLWKLIDAAVHTMPKILFIYMPIFAFWIWLVHGKRRWYFFDHGIFTLHYFSFLLLLYCIVLFSPLPLLYINNTLYEVVSNILNTIYIVYTIFYFFRSHSSMYGETKTISRLKSLLLFIINIICISIAIVLAFAYILYNIH